METSLREYGQRTVFPFPSLVLASSGSEGLPTHRDSQALKPPLGYLKYTAIKESVSSGGRPGGSPLLPFHTIQHPTRKNYLPLSFAEAMLCLIVRPCINIPECDF